MSGIFFCFKISKSKFFESSEFKAVIFLLLQIEKPKFYRCFRIPGIFRCFRIWKPIYFRCFRIPAIFSLFHNIKTKISQLIQNSKLYYFYALKSKTLNFWYILKLSKFHLLSNQNPIQTLNLSLLLPIDF